MRWCAILCLELGIGLMLGVAGQDNRCSEINGQKNVDINELRGDWYSIETIYHTRSTDGQQVTVETNGVSTGAIKTKLLSCPKVFINPVEIEGNPRIYLLWREPTGTVEYTFWVSKSKGGGVWNSDIKQNGTMTEHPTYKHFLGTVHVMKAVASNVLLTFCGRMGPEFSFLLGREHKLPKSDVKGARSLIQYRHIPMVRISETCSNAARTTSHGSFTMLLGLAVVALWKASNLQQ